ncbi:MAG: hypothetical protein MJA31_15750 [Clostridia bacterium]|nr:hypothetical protein [Clostridia bacterium]
MLIYGVKFCGGCNPRYERGKLLNRIKKDFENIISFQNAVENVEYDGLLVIGGCTNCCAAYKDIKTKNDPILIWDEKQYNDIVAELSKINKEGK